MYYIVGLGNPGEEYAATRHNVGAMALETLQQSFTFSDWKNDTSLQALVAKGAIADSKTWLLFPQTYMNRSGLTLKSLVTTPKKAEKLIVLYDEIDLPLGTIRVAYGRNSGGHNGVESLIRTVKTKDFIRIRIGICPTTPTGKLKKPKGQQPVLDFLMGPLKKPEREKLQEVFERVAKAVEVIVKEGREKAMNRYNRESPGA